MNNEGCVSWGRFCWIFCKRMASLMPLRAIIARQAILEKDRSSKFANESELGVYRNPSPIFWVRACIAVNECWRAFWRSPAVCLSPIPWKGVTAFTALLGYTSLPPNYLDGPHHSQKSYVVQFDGACVAPRCLNGCVVFCSTDGRWPRWPLVIRKLETWLTEMLASKTISSSVYNRAQSSAPFRFISFARDFKLI